MTDHWKGVMKMGVISDAIDSLEDWCSNLFKDGVKSQFDNISSFLINIETQNFCDFLQKLKRIRFQAKK